MILAGIAVLPVQAQSADVLPTETAITVNDTNYACIPESVHWQQGLPPGVVGSEDPFQNPPSYESIPGAPHRAYNDMHMSIQAAGKSAGSQPSRTGSSVAGAIAAGALEDAIRLYLATHNADPTPFVRGKTADDILASIARFALRTSEAGH